MLLLEGGGDVGYLLIAHKGQIGCERIDLTSTPATLLAKVLVCQRSRISGHSNMCQHLEQCSRVREIECGISAWTVRAGIEKRDAVLEISMRKSVELQCLLILI